MYAARPVARASLPRTLRSARAPRNANARFQSTSSGSSASSNSHLMTGIASGAAVAVVGYGIYSFTPAGRMASQVNKTTKDAYTYYNEASKKLQNTTPNADEAIDYVKQFAYSYVAWIPGGKKYVDTAFKDLDTLRESHGEEVNKIVNETYGEIQQVAKSGFSMDSVNKSFDALSRLSQKIGALAGSAFDDILDNHPQLKDKIGQPLDQLKQMGDQYGPEAKEEVNKTWDQVKDVMKGGLSYETVNKVRKLIEEKTQQVQKLGDEAWKKGMEQAKPYLEKNPKIKELVEKNTDALKSGNAKELFDKVKSSIDSGKTDELEDYVNSAVDKAKSQGSKMGGMGGFGNLEQYFNMIPGASEALPKLAQLKEVAEKHKGDGEKLLKETMEELQKVLQKQADKASDLVEKAKKESK